jgi:nucleoside-diphosphate kinase
MAIQRTFSMIKPEAVAAGRTGAILAQLEQHGFRIRGAKLVRFSKAQAEGFYQVHRERPFFAALTEYISSGPALAMVLEREDAILKLREVMGATDPAKAAPGTIRQLFGTSLQENAIHGSDAEATAAFEIGYVFSGLELIA